MMDIKVNIPFALDLDKDHVQKESIEQKEDTTESIFNKRLNVISETEPLNTDLANSSKSVQPINSNRKEYVRFLDLATTVQNGYKIFDNDPVLMLNPYINPYIMKLQ